MRGPTNTEVSRSCNTNLQDDLRTDLLCLDGRMLEEWFDLGDEPRQAGCPEFDTAIHISLMFL